MVVVGNSMTTFTIHVVLLFQTGEQEANNYIKQWKKSNMSPQTAWVVLLVAGVFEAMWAAGLEYSEGFSKLRPTVATVIALIISMILLAKAVETLPVGTAYAVWTGIGASITVISGIILFDETVTYSRMFFIGVIITGIIGLQAVSAS